MARTEDNFIDINEHELDREWVEQPKLYYKWAKKLADKRLYLDEAKANFDLVKADLDARIRADPDEFDLGEKVTEASVQACILRQVEYVNAQQELNAARHEVNVLEAGVSALDHRKRALEKLVDLYGMQYFAEPTVPKNERAKEYVQHRKNKMGK
jgi:hypothetical protein